MIIDFRVEQSLAKLLVPNCTLPNFDETLPSSNVWLIISFRKKTNTITEKTKRKGRQPQTAVVG